jgi:hypothetical protein
MNENTLRHKIQNEIIQLFQSDILQMKNIIQSLDQLRSSEEIRNQFEKALEIKYNEKKIESCTYRLGIFLDLILTLIIKILSSSEQLQLTTISRFLVTQKCEKCLFFLTQFDSENLKLVDYFIFPSILIYMKAHSEHLFKIFPSQFKSIHNLLHPLIFDLLNKNLFEDTTSKNLFFSEVIPPDLFFEDSKYLFQSYV